jgi:hypothetical protein
MKKKVHTGEGSSAQDRCVLSLSPAAVIEMAVPAAVTVFVVVEVIVVPIINNAGIGQLLVPVEKGGK